jgi:IPT/TIG domain
MVEEVVIKSGETVSFPVEANHAFAKFQSMVRPEQIENLAELAVARHLATTSTEGDSLKPVIAKILSSAGVDTVLDISVPDLVIEAGATMILKGPISKITAGHLTIMGKLLAYGSLNLICESVGGARLPVVTGLSVDHGPPLGHTMVMINGQNLDNLSAVYFGDQVATTIFGGDGTQVEAYSPAGAPGAVHVTVMTHGAFRSQNTPADLFTYMYSPAIKEMAITPNPLWTGDAGAGVITLDGPAPAGGLPISLAAGTLGQGEPGLNLPASVIVPEGATSAQFQVTSSAPMWPNIIATTAVGYTAAVDLTIYAGTVALTAKLAELDTSGPYLVAGQTATVTAFVRQAAPIGGAAIALSTNVPTRLTVPAQIALSPGANSTSFTIQASSFIPPQSVIAFVSAHYEGGSAISEEFTLLKDFPPANL